MSKSDTRTHTHDDNTCRLFYIPPKKDPNEIQSGQRTGQAIFVESSTLYYKKHALLSISEIYGSGSPPSVIMSLAAGVFLGVGSSSLRSYYQLRKCSQCPFGMTSIQGATSVDQCKCDTGWYFDYQTLSCKEAKQSCGQNEYVVAWNTPTSDTQCLPCPSCPIGTYRDANDCLRDKLRSYTQEPVCHPCLPNGCDYGFYKVSDFCHLG
jgi:hypothetical protein